MLFDERLSALYHERLISHFLVWKAYLEILCRIVFNISNRFSFPLVTSGTDFSSSDLETNRITTIYYNELVIFCKKLSVVSCSNFSSEFVVDVFKGCKKVVDYFSRYL